jgi:hypothetical protein
MAQEYKDHTRDRSQAAGWSIAEELESDAKSLSKGERRIMFFRKVNQVAERLEKLFRDTWTAAVLQREAAATERFPKLRALFPQRPPRVKVFLAHDSAAALEGAAEIFVDKKKRARLIGFEERHVSIDMAWSARGYQPEEDARDDRGAAREAHKPEQDTTPVSPRKNPRGEEAGEEGGGRSLAGEEGAVVGGADDGAAAAAAAAPGGGAKTRRLAGEAEPPPRAREEEKATKEAEREDPQKKVGIPAFSTGAARDEAYMSKLQAMADWFVISRSDLLFCKGGQSSFCSSGVEWYIS